VPKGRHMKMREKMKCSLSFFFCISFFAGAFCSKLSGEYIRVAG